MFEVALQERMRQYSCKCLGVDIEDKKAGFPTLDELGMVSNKVSIVTFFGHKHFKHAFLME